MLSNAVGENGYSWYWDLLVVAPLLPGNVPGQHKCPCFTTHKQGSLAVNVPALPQVYHNTWIKPVCSVPSSWHDMQNVLTLYTAQTWNRPTLPCKWVQGTLPRAVGGRTTDQTGGVHTGQTVLWTGSTSVTKQQATHTPRLLILLVLFIPSGWLDDTQARKSQADLYGGLSANQGVRHIHG